MLLTGQTLEQLAMRAEKRRLELMDALNQLLHGMVTSLFNLVEKSAGPGFASASAQLS
jgi:hypothetical protein